MWPILGLFLFIAKHPGVSAYGIPDKYTHAHVHCMHKIRVHTLQAHVHTHIRIHACVYMHVHRTPACTHIHLRTYMCSHSYVYTSAHSLPYMLLIRKPCGRCMCVTAAILRIFWKRLCGFSRVTSVPWPLLKAPFAVNTSLNLTVMPCKCCRSDLCRKGMPP